MLTIERLRALLDYDAATGIFTWRQHRSTKCRAGMRAGRATKIGYWVIMVDGRNYLAGRVALAYINGRWPVTVDHADKDGLNDRLSNLREASRSQNNANRIRPISSKNPYRGVYRHRLKWQAKIRICYPRGYLCLGTFDAVEDAARAYNEAARNMFGAFAQLNAIPCAS